VKINRMAIPVTEFKNSCLDVIRRVETTGQSVSITRRGKVVARLSPSLLTSQSEDAKPWQTLRELGGKLLAGPGESVLHIEDFEALR
jgi:prevent-host-death family protein